MATNHESAAAQEVLDPVCGMTILPADAAGHATYQGRTYYFCNESCVDRFRANPAQFIEANPIPASSTTRQPVDAEYTCPMDPEVRQTGPGACPK